MPSIQNNVGTFNLSSESITITESMGVRNISVLKSSGTVTVTGTMKLGSRVSDTITLGDTPLNVTFDFAIDGYIINASAGVALVITGR